MDEQEIRQAGRPELEHYLRTWGFEVYDHETTDELRDAALENFRTEGEGFGPTQLAAERG